MQQLTFAAKIQKRLQFWKLCELKGKAQLFKCPKVLAMTNNNGI